MNLCVSLSFDYSKILTVGDGFKVGLIEGSRVGKLVSATGLRVGPVEGAGIGLDVGLVVVMVTPGDLVGVEVCLVYEEKE